MMKNLIQKWMARRRRHAFIVATAAATQRELLFTQPVGAINQGPNFMDVGFRERRRKKASSLILTDNPLIKLAKDSNGLVTKSVLMILFGRS